MKVIIAILFLMAPVFISENISADELSDSLSGFENFDGAISNNQHSQAGNELSDLDESGFDTINPTKNITSDYDEMPSWYSINGSLSALGAYNYAQNPQSIVASGDLPMDFSGVSRARFKGGLAVDMKHGSNWRSKFEIIAWYDASWAIKDKENYTQEILDTYESFFDIKDVFIQGSLSSNIDLKFGRQLVIWGKSDSIRITDIINPLDNREAGMTDIEDLRLSETMTRLDYYFGDWGLSGIVIHEPRLEIEPAFGSDYRPSDVFGAPIPYAKFPNREKPSWQAENMQYAMSLDGRFSGWDLSFYAANVFDNRFNVKADNNSPTRYYDKIKMLGIASNIVSGSWLFKVESAFITDINYRSTDRKSRLDALIGFDYMGISNTVVSLELANRHILNYEDEMLTLTLEDAAAQGTFPDFVRKDTVQMAMRSTYRFNHDNASVTYLISLLGGNGPGDSLDGGFQRLWLNYKYSDTLSLNTGIVDYIGGNSIIPFYRAIKDNDRLFAEAKYSF